MRHKFKKIIFILILLPCAVFSASPNILGTWKFTSYRYQGKENPLPNPDLDLRFTFDDKGFSHLKWLRLNESGICHRLAQYAIQPDQVLFQKTVWLDPKNDISCGSDPEMQLGKESFTYFDLENDKLLLHLELSGEDFVYVMSPVF